MGRYSWSRLSDMQVGRFGEYVAKMEFALYGFEVFTSEVDDRGIDFVARYESGQFYEIQVKSVRGLKNVYLRKDKFPLHDGRHLTLVLLKEEQPPEVYLIPATIWQVPNSPFVDLPYEGLKSKPEYGLNLSAKNLPLIEQYRFEAVINSRFTANL
jgi:hypothetical protein